jgi:SAM-dependent methyltransferase
MSLLYILRKSLKSFEEIERFTGTSAIAYGMLAERQSISSNPKVLLDIGCGKGNFMKALNEDMTEINFSSKIGVDVFLPSLLKAKKVYDNVVQADVRFLPFKDSSFDIVMANQIIEHLTKADGLQLLNDAERLSTEMLIITVPVGFNPKSHIEDDNPWQIHQSAWHPDEFKDRAFTVYGYAGARFLLAEKGEFKLKSKALELFLFMLARFTQLITRRLVTASFEMACIKLIKNSHSCVQAL